MENEQKTTPEEQAANEPRLEGLGDAPLGRGVETQSSLWRNIRLVASAAMLVVGVAAKAYGILNWVELGFGILGLFGLVVVTIVLEQIQRALSRIADEHVPPELLGFVKAIGRLGPAVLYVFASILCAVALGLVGLGGWFAWFKAQETMEASRVVAHARGEADAITREAEKNAAKARQESASLVVQATEDAEKTRREAGIPSRSRFSEPLVLVRVERADVKWGQTTGDPLRNDENSLYRRSMDDWFGWLRRGGGPSKGEDSVQLLVVELASENGFQHYFNDISCVVAVNDQLQLEQGICFLVKDDAGGSVYRPIYRQMPFKIAPDSSGTKFTNQLKLLQPDQGETMLMVLRVRRTDGTPCELAPAWYGVRVEVP